jgi:hypothetical protein
VGRAKLLKTSIRLDDEDAGDGPDGELMEEREHEPKHQKTRKHCVVIM